MIEPERIELLADRPVDRGASYVLYWMQQSQREPLNPALEYAAAVANELGMPLLTTFGIAVDYPDANRRHFAFMFEGMAETTSRLAKRGIKLIVRVGSPPDVAASLAGDAALIVCDRGYLRNQRHWRRQLVDKTDKRIVQVEGDVVVPVELASDKREWAARTIRNKINNKAARFITAVPPTRLAKSSLPLHVRSDVDLRQAHQLLDDLDINQEVGAVTRFAGGTHTARERLAGFLRHGLAGYAGARNDPSDPCASQLSPYLHFGQISPVEIAQKVVRSTTASEEDKTSFLEELVVRRELACNFVYYTPDYDKYKCLPEWALKTLSAHKPDRRPVRYTRRQLENAATDDRYWNAAMQEMLKTGYMHNHMRMYWGKKILEWSNTPEYAYATTLYLNNKYFLDGRDPNSYANVGWIFGLHDRAWTEREVFGKVRYMNAGGLERKFDIEKYVSWVDALE